MSCKLPDGTAWMASPSAPLSPFRASGQSDFICPIVGSMAWRRLSRFSLRGSRPVWRSKASRAALAPRPCSRGRAAPGWARHR